MPRPTSTMRTRSIVFLGIFGLLLVAAAGCEVSVSTSGDDAKPASSSTPPPASTSAPDPSGSDEVDYVACLMETAAGDATKALGFYATVHRTTDNVSISLQPLKAGAATVSSAGVVGTAVQASSALQGGSFTLPLGKLTVPAAANPLGGDLVVDGASLTGTLSCAHLGGTLEGDAGALDPAKNVCKFLLVKDGDATPAVTADTFKCN